MRPCDVRRAFEVLDKVFLADPVDTFYAARREHGTIVSLACGEPEETCFCTVFGVDCTEPETAAEGLVDVAAWFVEDTLYLRSRYGKRNGSSGSCEAFCTEAENTDEAKVEAQKEICPRHRARSFPTPIFPWQAGTADDMMEKFNIPESGRSFTHPCLACGTCTFVCPTCQCYDITRFTIPDMASSVTAAGTRCMYSDFTMMAHGNNRNHARCSASVSDSCISWYISRQTTTACIPA